MTQQMVYVVTMFAVYEHGCGGVFTSREAAERHAAALAEDSDWHHDFAIEEIAVDQPLTTDPRYVSWRKSTEKVKSTRPTVEFGAWDAEKRIYRGHGS